MLRRRDPNPPSLAALSTPDRHLLRMTRGRDLASERLAALHSNEFAVSQFDTFGMVSPVWQRQAAKKMLDDFEASGVDEDLEHLRASWTTPFAARPGVSMSGSSRRSSHSSTAFTALACRPNSIIEDEDDGAPRGALFKQGEQAKERLRTLEALRKLAGSPGNSNTSLQTACLGGSSSSCYAPPPCRQQHKCIIEHRLPQTRRVDFDKFDTPPSEAQEPGSDSWDSWSARWAREFEKFDDMQAARQWREEEAARCDLEEMARRDAQAHASRRSAAQAASKHAKKMRQEAEEAMRRRAEADFKQRETGRRFSEATRRQQRPRAECDSSGSSDEDPPAARRKPPPVSSSSRSSATSVANKSPPHPQHSSFADFDQAWRRFEQQAATTQSISYSSVPWPTSLLTISGVDPIDSVAEKKRKLRAALVRWHPDKWSPVMAKVCEGDRQQVMDQVKEITQRLLDEKKRFGV